MFLFSQIQAKRCQTNVSEELASTQLSDYTLDSHLWVSILRMKTTVFFTVALLRTLNLFHVTLNIFRFLQNNKIELYTHIPANPYWQISIGLLGAIKSSSRYGCLWLLGSRDFSPRRHPWFHIVRHTIFGNFYPLPTVTNCHKFWTPHKSKSQILDSP